MPERGAGGARIRALVRTTAFRLTVSYGALMALSGVLLALFFYWSTVGALVRETDATLRTEVTGLAEQYIEHGLDRLVDVIAHRIRTDRSGDMLYAFARADGRPLAGNLRRWPDAKPDPSGWLEFTHTRADGDTILARARIYRLRDGLRLLVGRNVTPLEALEQTFRRALAIVLVLTLVLGLGGGIFMSSRVLRRVGDFTAVTREVVDGRLDRRLTARSPGDEFDVLAEHLNTMLDRLQSLIAAVQHVSDNIAHDLRLPLTRLRNRLELAAREAGPDTARELEGALAEADALLATFAALLRIARIEAGSYPAAFARVDIGLLLGDALELYAEVARERDVSLVRDGGDGLAVDGDRNLLFQAVVNLIDNAVKFAPDGSRISVGAHERAGRVRIEVADGGPGIPDEQRERVTGRFVRLDESRSRPGSGLGLSLVQAVATLHGGGLTFADNAPGLRAALDAGPVTRVPDGSP